LEQEDNGSKGIRLDSPGGIYGNVTFLDSISMNNTLTWFPCLGSIYCTNSTFLISAQDISIEGNVDVSQAFYNNLTFLNNSGVNFNNSGYIYPGPRAGQLCDLIFGNSICTNKLFLNTISDLILLNNSGIFNLSNGQMIVQNLTVANLNFTGFLQFSN